MFIPEKLLNASGTFHRILESKIYGLYFSASYVVHRSLPLNWLFRNKFSDEFEVILIGGDGSSKAQANYMKKYSMPWYAMQNQSAEAKFATGFVRFNQFHI